MLHKLQLWLLLTRMGLSRIVSEINGDFGRKLQIFPSRIFNAALKGFPLDR